jgi:hypothetical protein
MCYAAAATAAASGDASNGAGFAPLANVYSAATTAGGGDRSSGGGGGIDRTAACATACEALAVRVQPVYVFVVCHYANTTTTALPHSGAVARAALSPNVCVHSMSAASVSASLTTRRRRRPASVRTAALLPQGLAKTGRILATGGGRHASPPSPPPPLSP